MKVRSNACDDRGRRRIPEWVGLHDVDAVDHHTKLPEATLDPTHLHAWLIAQLRRHPGGNEGFAGSDGAVMNVDAAHGDSGDV